MNFEMAVLGSPALIKVIVSTVFVDVKKHYT